MQETSPCPKDVEIDDLQLQATEAAQRVMDLQLALGAKEAEAEQLREANNKYTSMLTPLQDEIMELRTTKEALEQIVQNLHSRNTAVEEPARERNIPYVHQAEITSSIGDFVSDAGTRPLSGDTRVGTSHSNVSGKAIRTPGINVRPSTAGDQSKQRLWEIYENQRVTQRDTQRDHEEDKSLSPRSKKLQKKREIERAREQHGKLYNLVHFGSLGRPEFIRKVEERATLYRY